MRSFRDLGAFYLVCLAFVGTAATQVVARDAGKTQLPAEVSFNAHIRPLMSNTCFVCHGPAGEENPSELRLDSFAAASADVPSGEGKAIVPGNPKKSVVLRRIFSDDPDLQMPPPEFRHQLTDREKALFKRWIEQGAEYQVHWAYAPLEPVEPPEVKNASNEIDAFIVARLEEEGLKLSPQADKTRLLRRLSLDLIGLPPTPEELQAFLADSRPEAYERQVDRLLASPHYGERMASPWLDIVRFADTVGFHGDQNQRIFSYRDYVIDAFNNNKPFDEFTREQLAGDLLPNPTDEQLTATGFTRLNMVTREGGAQPAEYLAKYTADRVRAIGTAWLGSTMGCCECHDHKYDPFTMKDFYSLGAFFADLRQWGVYNDYGYSRNPDLRGFNNDWPFPPELYRQSRTLNERIDFLQRESDQQIAAELEPEISDSAEFHQWTTAMQALLGSFAEGWVAGAVRTTSSEKGTPLKQLGDGSLLHSGKPKKADVTTIELEFPTSMPLVAIRVEALPDALHGGNVGRGKNGSFQVEVELALKRHSGKKEAALQVAWSQCDHQSPKHYRNGRPGLNSEKVWRSLPARWQVPSDGSKLPHTAIHHLAQPLQLGAEDRVIVRLKSDDIGRVRISATPLAEAIPGRAAAGDRLIKTLSKDPTHWEPEQQNTLLAAYYRATTPPNQVSDTCKKFRSAIQQCRAGYAHTLIAQQLPQEKYLVSRILPRGNWQDESGEVLSPGVPGFLPQPTIAKKRRLTRLDLANWLTSPENPLTARHFVNRLWKQLFGAGFSNKLDDLGNQGEWPSHPQLLDWLASEFRDSGWNVKHTVKLIVMSQTYRQRAAHRNDLAEIDPYNRLLSQQSARRLDAEAVRDNALAISGLLSCELIGGPSVFPYQPPGYYRDIQFPNRKYANSIDDRQYRRGVYMHWQRTFLHPMLANFDAPARDECTADRVISNSPQQALTLLNDPTFVEASGALAHSLLTELPQAEFAELLDRAFVRALSRPAKQAEHESLRQLYQDQMKYYAGSPEEAKAFQRNTPNINGSDVAAEKLAAWAQVCRVILNLHETITRY